MSRERFDDECPGCRPAMADAKTMRPLADDSPEMVIVNQIWGETTLKERLAWHRFTCLNSRDAEDLRHVKTFTDRIEEAFAIKKSERPDIVS